MNLVRFKHASEIKYGALNGDQITVINGDIFGSYELTNQVLPQSEVTLLSPCVPTKAVCVGLNYLDHAKEMNMELPARPLIFIKPSSALTHPGGNVEYPEISQNLHFEAELAIVIKKQARKVSVAEADEYVLGYTCANDVTARDIQLSDGQWTRGKSFDTFLPLGPSIATDIDPNNVDIKLYLNDEVKQSSNTENFIFKAAEMVSFVSQVMTLYPGDVILTGTPAGVGPMQVGDVVTVEIEGIGKLSNTIVKG